MKQKGRSKKLSKGMKILLGISCGVAILAAVFIGLYFGVPEFHDWITPAKEVVETTASLM